MENSPLPRFVSHIEFHFRERSHPTGRPRLKLREWNHSSKLLRVLMVQLSECTWYLPFLSTSYCPVVLVLEPGEHLHIGKGRFHAFRKLSSETLANIDCHSDLREETLRKLRMEGIDFGSIVNFSIAWDWSFLGWTAEGINREMVAALEYALRNRNVLQPKQSLAIPKLCLLKRCMQSEAHLSAGKAEDPQFHHKILRGLLPALEFVVSHEKRSVLLATSQKVGNPNTSENPDLFPVDPYGNSDYTCSICFQELCNTYMHCQGCERLLGKDYNVCTECHALGKHREFVIKNSWVDSVDSCINHTGAFPASTHEGYSCGKTKLCPFCRFGRECCCRCHSEFSLEQRFFRQEQLCKLLSGTRKIVGEETIPFSDQVFPRLTKAGQSLVMKVGMTKG